MYGISIPTLTYIYHKSWPNVGKYTIYWAFGIAISCHILWGFLVNLGVFAPVSTRCIPPKVWCMVRDLVDAHCVQPQTGLGGGDRAAQGWARRIFVHTSRTSQEPAVYEFIFEFDLLYHGNNVGVFELNYLPEQSRAYQRWDSIFVRSGESILNV